MNKIKIINFIGITICIGMSFFISCTTDLDEPENILGENINGFEVCWRSQISENQKEIIRGILNNMVWVEGGYFTMGATSKQSEFARNNEYPTSYIYLDDYYICCYEVSDEVFNTIMDSQKSSTDINGSRITLEEWQRFIEKLKDFTSLKFNFPTEAQWEYAARGGRFSRDYIFPGSNDIEEVNSASHLYGSECANELGLYNMADLKSEWCLDYYDRLIGGERIYFNWIQNEGDDHVVRGGNFRCTEKNSDTYYPKSNSTISELSYNIAYGLTLTKRNMDYLHCRITSRSYGYANEIGADYIGCRLVLNL